ncbi:MULTISPECIES: RidA family protein [Rhizobium]|uniref:RidA family protein n=1 Tax=Rhizobium TaxID=379 RepID=UPI000A1EC2ED|nr:MULTISPECIES: RidA family protein [Rhizobium]ARM90967.1 endoribonuclease L-PSP protein [Rhizobium sp. CIAT894]MBB4299557.1 enamine deaminase RidA (YjgF/YER057c/UK114 family) [Rhizobium leguminosarum]MBB4310995.1 enamine deaminase RidA (YjgF/YER057c/UK114 family) [Rhizobium leguminosarum]MBB4419893.1 enamine deaminase RidA (YjgF/YER057c/UK114 family) [Rhizobium leguminosarum]MBB4435111.1 enamine deaminase RidA (YjgF/YER057c/UK114 family) [Rhizobium esperanzae]
MNPSFEQRIIELAIGLPKPHGSVANYVAAHQVGNLLFVSGQLCMSPGGTLVATGSLGANISVEDGIQAARAAAINVVAQAKASLGNLDKIKRVVRLGGFIAATPSFSEHARVMNGASDVIVEIFGEQGRHTRSTIGVSSLPLQAAVEVEALFELN